MRKLIPSSSRLAKPSVIHSLAKAFIFIILISVLSSALVLFTLIRSLFDSESMYIAGSWGMQSYRIAHDLYQKNDLLLQQHLVEYQQTLTSSAVTRLDSPYLPKKIRQRYRQIQQQWSVLEGYIQQRQTESYHQLMPIYVENIHQLMIDLKKFAEFKIFVLGSISLIGLFAIVLLVLLTIRFIKQRVVTPLDALVNASQQIEKHQFNHMPLDTHSANELGVLARAFTQMSGELGKFYDSLEQQVQQQTEQLTRANRRLSLLYNCAKTLNANHSEPQNFQRVLDTVLQDEAIYAIRLHVTDHQTGQWSKQAGGEQAACPWQIIALTQDNKMLGTIEWQARHPEEHQQLMQGVANMLSRSIDAHIAQKRYQQLLLIEERAIISRELHDSLAQSLSFLRIQLTRLKVAWQQDQRNVADIIHEFDQALATAYQQLRELLDTFRLSIEEADLNLALQQVIEPLRQQTDAQIDLQIKNFTPHLNAQKQVHILQITREAVLNAIKHAKAKHITIDCHSSEQQHQVTINDDGIGISQLDEPLGHYGLTIMNERTKHLNGELIIKRNKQGGTQVCLIFPQ